MYEKFYGLTSKPFQLSPDPNFYFGSKQHRRAKAYLDYGVLRNDGFIVITGEIGAGKTTLLRGLLDSLSRNKVVLGSVVSTQLDADDTLRMVGAAFGVRVKDLSKSEVLMGLEAFFVSQVALGKRCLLVVDEAQNLSAKAVEELRMLSNFQFGNQALLQTFLVGQPEFRVTLQTPDMEQFRQRVAATCHIGPLDEEETRLYIQHRLKCAGSSGSPEFEASAFLRIHAESGGIPRRINTICDRLLLLGFMSERTLISAADVDEVVKDLRQESELPVLDRRDAVGDGALKVGGASTLELCSLSADVADAFSAKIDQLALEQHSDRLHRLERSMMRLERINLQTLSLLQKLVELSKKPSDEASS